MIHEQPQHPVSAKVTVRPFSHSVTVHPDGGWLIVVDLSEGVTLSKWFPHEQDAYCYAEQLAAWLSPGDSS
jgi:hypothetical protein